MDQVARWITGDLSQQARIWTALAPGLLVAAVWVVALLVFSLKVLREGLPRTDAEIEKRERTVLVGVFLRYYFFWLLNPIWRLLLAAGIPANALTTLSALLGLASGFAVAAGRFALGGWLFLGAGMLDAIDGRLARARSEASPSGAAIDSVLDRYTDSALLVGLAWYYRESWVLIPVLLALVGGSMVPYVRARGEGLGVSIRSGQFSRTERVVLLGVSVTLAPVPSALWEPPGDHPIHWLVVGALVLVAVGSNITAISRLIALVRALGGKLVPAPRHWSAQLGLHLLASAIATGIDYAIVVGLVEWSAMRPAWATAIGSAIGAVINFSFNRSVTFRSSEAKAPQAGRYAFVSATSLLLNSGGMAVLALHPTLDYRLAWWLVRAAVYFLWNFPMQRDWVFAAQTAATPVGERNAA